MTIMKKLILTIAVVLGGLVTMNAQEVKQLKSSNDKIKAEKLEKKEAVKNQQTLRTSTDAISKKEAKRNSKAVSVDQLPNAVQKQVKENFNNSTISKASVNAKGIYRLEVMDANNAKKIVYITQDGKLVNQSLRGQ